MPFVELVHPLIRKRVAFKVLQVLLVNARQVGLLRITKLIRFVNILQCLNVLGQSQLDLSLQNQGELLELI